MDGIYITHISYYRPDEYEHKAEHHRLDGENRRADTRWDEDIDIVREYHSSESSRKVKEKEKYDPVHNMDR